MKVATLEVSQKVLRALGALLDQVNGRRTTRLLSLDDVRVVAEAAVGSASGFAVRHGGDLEDARQLTTLCLAVRRDDGVVVGLGAARTGQVSAARAFPDLDGWDSWNETNNVVRCEAWARKAGADRLLVPFAPRPAQVSDPGSMLDAIVQRPDDDDARRVYADLLLERGDPRGELIVVQQALTQPGLDDPRRHELQARERALLSAHGRAWLGTLSADGLAVSFARGFIDAVTVLDAEALFAATETLEREPLRHLVFATRRRVDLARVLSLPWISRVRELDFRASRDAPTALGREGLSLLLTTRKLRGLTALGLWTQSLGDVGAALLESEGPGALPALAALAVVGDTLTAAGVEALMKTRWFSGLRRLSLDHNELGPDGAAALSAGKKGRLMSLSLAANRLGNDGAFALARAARLSSLEALWLTSNRIGPAGAEALLASIPLKGVRRLVLDGNPVGAKLKVTLAQRQAGHAG